jgi:hypothetical protein
MFGPSRPDTRQALADRGVPPVLLDYVPSKEDEAEEAEPEG